MSNEADWPEYEALNAKCLSDAVQILTDMHPHLLPIQRDQIARRLVEGDEGGVRLRHTVQNAACLKQSESEAIRRRIERDADENPLHFRPVISRERLIEIRLEERRAQGISLTGKEELSIARAVHALSDEQLFEISTGLSVDLYPVPTVASVAPTKQREVARSQAEVRYDLLANRELDRILLVEHGISWLTTDPTQQESYRETLRILTRPDPQIARNEHSRRVLEAKERWTSKDMIDAGRLGVMPRKEQVEPPAARPVQTLAEADREAMHARR